MKLLAVILATSFLFSCHDSTNPERKKNPDFKHVNQAKEPFFEVIVSENSPTEFGYQILKDGVLLIDQKTIPAVQGNRSFFCREDAQRVADYILLKIMNGIFPPTISVVELDSLGVLD
jgi:hypothetical protein